MASNDRHVDLEELVEEFALLPSLLTSTEPRDLEKRRCLEMALDEALQTKSETEKTLLAVYVLLRCPALVNITGIAGFEGLGHTLSEGFSAHADALSSRTKEETRYPDAEEVLLTQRHVTRRLKSFKNVVFSAFARLEKRGRPDQYERDSFRWEMFHIAHTILEMRPMAAYRWVAGMETYLAMGEEGLAKRPIINLGTDADPLLWEGSARRGIESIGTTTESVKITPQASDGDIERSITRLRTKGFSLETGVSHGEESDTHLLAVVESDVFKRIGKDMSCLIVR